jgi:hypothetical protein
MARDFGNTSMRVAEIAIYPAKTNPAVTPRGHAEGQWRKFGEGNRWEFDLRIANEKT